MSDIASLVDEIRRHYDDGCFACGRQNPIGLHIDDFDVDGEEVSARFSPRPGYRGAGSTLHGGVSATALDEIMVWAGILLEGVMSVTGTMDLRYRQPVTVEETGGILLRGWVVERRGRRLRLAGSLESEQAISVEASGMYLVTEQVEHLLGEPSPGPSPG